MALTNSLDELKELPIGKAVIQLKYVVTSGLTDVGSNIDTLSSTLNKTSDKLHEHISNLNKAFRNTATVIYDAVNNLKDDISNQIVEQQSKLKVASKKVQEIEDSVVFMMDKYKINDDSAVDHNIMVSIWVFLISLLVIVVVISVLVCKKRYENAYVDVPIMRYENRFSDHIGQRVVRELEVKM